MDRDLTNLARLSSRLSVLALMLAFHCAVSSELRYLTLPMGVVQGRPCPLVPDVTAYLGVPYAFPPTGNLRFRPPIIYDTTYPDNLLDATAYPPVCGTPCDGTGDPSVRKTVGEDCLYLNIWVPQNSLKWGDLPVKVYIHGGMNTACNANDLHIDGCPSTEITESVTINMMYRLGSPGFLAHPLTLIESNTTGNWGILDQQMALTWVQKYISYFGGNASKVLIYGGSSGGSLVSLQVSLEGSAGLFSAAISESATCYEALSLKEAYKLAAYVSNASGCPADQSEENLACLRNVSMVVLSDAVPDATTQMNCYEHERTPVFSPTIDGTVVKEQLVEAMAAGRSNQVPFLIGTNKNEGNFFIEHMYPDTYFYLTEDDLSAFLKTIYLDANITAIMDLYPAEYYAENEHPGYSRFAEVLTDLFVRCPGHRMLAALSGHDAPLYSYFFTHTPSCPVASRYMGCTHGNELLFVFGTTTNVYPPMGTCNYTDAEDKLADAFMYSWTQMAETGVPALQYGQSFPIWDSVIQNTTLLNLNITFDSLDISSRCEAIADIVSSAVDSGLDLSERLRSTYKSRSFAKK